MNLKERIGRVIKLSIEHRMLYLLEQKQRMAKGVLTGDEAFKWIGRTIYRYFPRMVICTFALGFLKMTGVAERLAVFLSSVLL